MELGRAGVVLGLVFFVFWVCVCWYVVVFSIFSKMHGVCAPRNGIYEAYLRRPVRAPYEL